MGGVSALNGAPVAGVSASPPPLSKPLSMPLGDRALLLQFSHLPEAHITSCLSGFYQALQQADHPCIVDLVPAFDTLCVHYDPLVLLRAGITSLEWIAQLTALPYQPLIVSATTLHSIPVCYELGLDLAWLADALGTTPVEVVRQHVNAEFQVAMIGFAPGFAYMRGLPAALCQPRRATPRTEVPTGSVAIANDLCGIYPRPLPGGWHIVGRTPITLFDPERARPSLLHTGDRVQFQSITRAQFEAWPC